MATYIATGRDLSLEIDGGTWTPQTGEVVLTYENTVETFQTLSGSKAVITGQEGTLDVTAFQDWGEAGSLFDALWSAADTGTSIPFVLTLTGGVILSGDCVPQFPSAGGAATDGLSSSISFVVDGAVAHN